MVRVPFSVAAEALLRPGPVTPQRTNTMAARPVRGADWKPTAAEGIGAVFNEICEPTRAARVLRRRQYPLE